MQHSMENDPIFPFATLRLSILRICALRERQRPGEYFTSSELAEALPDTSLRVKRCCLDLLKDGLLKPNFGPNYSGKFAISNAGVNLLAEYEKRNRQ